MVISIHALREEGDTWGKPMPLDRAISIHALREEGDAPRRPCKGGCWHFYPRPPRGGRPQSRSSRAAPRYFYPRPPRGGRHLCFLSALNVSTISIHALREEGDLLVLCKVHHQCDFYPRPPRGGRPLSSSVSLCRASNFYPRPPRGGRRLHHAALEPALLFLSTPSARRAT